MAQITRCEGCGVEGKPGQRWLRARIEPFTIYGSKGMDDCVPYNEGLAAEGCSPPCCAKLLAEQCRTLAGGYMQMDDALRTAFAPPRLFTPEEAEGQSPTEATAAELSARLKATEEKRRTWPKPLLPSEVLGPDLPA